MYNIRGIIHTRMVFGSEVGMKGRTLGVVYAIDITYCFRGSKVGEEARGRKGGGGKGEGRVNPSSEQILFKYFLVRPKNIFVTRL